MNSETFLYGLFFVLVVFPVVLIFVLYDPTVKDYYDVMKGKDK